jgi:hypothetical protein
MQELGLVDEKDEATTVTKKQVADIIVRIYQSRWVM